MSKTICNGPIECLLRLVEPLEACLLKVRWKRE